MENYKYCQLMLHTHNLSLKQASIFPEPTLKSNRSYFIPSKKPRESFLNHAESYSSIIKDKSESNEKSRFETRPSSNKSSLVCRDFTKKLPNEEILNKKVKFSPQTPLRSRKISVSKILKLVRAELPALPHLEQKAKLYVGLGKNFGMEDSNQYYSKYFGNTNSLLSKKSVERLKRKETLLSYLNKSPYQ